MKGAFRSLNSFNYRVWAGGALVSNVGTWMQRIAQSWLVLTQLTHNNASAVGMVMALQFGPHILLLPWTGFAADHFDRRKLLMATQAAWEDWPWDWGFSQSPDSSRYGTSMSLRFCRVV